MRAVLVGLVAAASLNVLVAQTSPTRSIRDGVYSEEQAQRGADVYSSYCASCHAADLLGGVNPNATATRLVVPSLRGGEFVAKYTQMRLSDLFYRMRASMPQDAPGSLSRSKNADLLAFLLRENGYPAAAAGELRQNDDEWMNDILVEAELMAGEITVACEGGDHLAISGWVASSL
jgi:cytochrome c